MPVIKYPIVRLYWSDKVGFEPIKIFYKFEVYIGETRNSQNNEPDLGPVGYLAMFLKIGTIFCTLILFIWQYRWSSILLKREFCVWVLLNRAY